MPILHTIGRRGWRGRALIAGMYALLVIGAAGMVYPFLLMLSGSLKTDLDFRQFEIIPRYLRDDTILFRKFLSDRYGAQLDWFEAATGYEGTDGRPAYSFETIEWPDARSAELLDEWLVFLDAEAGGWPDYFMQLGHGFGFRTIPETTALYIQRLRRDFPGISRRELPMRIAPERWTDRAYQPARGPFAQTYRNLRAELPRRYFIPTSLSGAFIMHHLVPKYGRGPDALARINAAWGTRHNSLHDIRLTPRAPEQAGFRADWWDYVRERLPVRFVTFDEALLGDYRAFLRARYGELDALRASHGRAYANWDEPTFPAPGDFGAPVADAEAFLASREAPDGIALDGPEFRWRTWLARRGAAPDIAAAAPMPTFAYDAHLLRAHRGEITREFLTRNYRIVWDYLAGHGRALRNTVIFCALAVLTALIVNPLAAYALSRYQPGWGYKVLFFLMATMAFPAEVTQIPAFLMLREMGWLNTFAALVIPAAANGYSIFLLKGFFDSLPRDLYESAELDGAGEFRMFFTITVPLSAPILAVVALGAFTAAYGAFMFALLVCQQESMWTLMVHIYQLQQLFGTPIVFAALVVAALPTLIVFVFCQNIILRGIVVPVEK